MKRSCALRGERGQREEQRDESATGDYHGNSPSRNCAASGDAGCFEETVGGRALDEPALVQEQDLVAEPARLAEVVRDHHDLGAGRVHRAR